MRELLAALDDLPDPAWCNGRCPITVPLEVRTPEGSVVIDRGGLGWLYDHSEPAPFGDTEGTKFDSHVRVTHRLTARGATEIANLDVAAIVTVIERALAVDCRLTAELLDVLIYRAGGHFAPHKDTPRTGDQLGTLIVELPMAHRGGELVVTDGDTSESFVWGDPEPAIVRWVALFGDVDHSIQRVTSGTRLTAVYTLRYRTADRLDASQRSRADAITDAAIALYESFPAGTTLAIPCGRMIVTARDDRFPLAPTVLRGADRVIAAAFARAGCAVEVDSCIVLADDDDQTLEQAIGDANVRTTMLARPIPDAVIRDADGLSWASEVDSDFEFKIATLADYVARERGFPAAVWLVRARARSASKMMWFSHSGYFGNEYHVRYMYRFALMVVRVPAISG